MTVHFDQRLLLQNKNEEPTIRVNTDTTPSAAACSSPQGIYLQHTDHHMI